MNHISHTHTHTHLYVYLLMSKYEVFVDAIHLFLLSLVFYLRTVESPGNLATLGLAKVGARAALSFAFAFLKRAWRSGEDSDLCTDVLQESLGILQEMPVALLFDTGAVSEVWIDVVDRAKKFLTDVCRG